VKSATTPIPINVYSPTAVSTLADARTQRQDGTQKLTRITFEVPDEHGPTLRSVVEEMSNQVGQAIEENIYLFGKENSLTVAAAVLGKMRAAVNAKIDCEDPDFAL
jgi:hypothetical protein